MEQVKSIVKAALTRFEQWSITIFWVLAIVILAWAVGFAIQDSRSGHLELIPAVIIEKIYKPAIDDVLSIPDGYGNIMTIDTSTPPRFIIKISLADRAVKTIKIGKKQFKLLNVGQSVNLNLWIGRSGRIYQGSILANAAQQNIADAKSVSTGKVSD